MSPFLDTKMVTTRHFWAQKSPKNGRFLTTSRAYGPTGPQNCPQKGVILGTRIGPKWTDLRRFSTFTVYIRQNVENDRKSPILAIFGTLWAYPTRLLQKSSEVS